MIKLIQSYYGFFPIRSVSVCESTNHNKTCVSELKRSRCQGEIQQQTFIHAGLKYFNYMQ